MNYIVVVILLVLAACATYFALKYNFSKTAEFLLNEFAKKARKYELQLMSNETDFEINVGELFPGYFKADDIATSSEELRRAFIIIGYDIERFSERLVHWQWISYAMYKEFFECFSEIKLTAFEKGELFREEDLKGKKKKKR